MGGCRAASGMRFGCRILNWDCHRQSANEGNATKTGDGLSRVLS
jgi:hypothetical protein